MKILHIIDSEGLYGAEAVLLSLATAQQRLGHSPVVVSIRTLEDGKKAIEREAAARGLSIEIVRMVNGPNPRGSLNLVDLARREGADVLHSHGYKSDILLGFLPRRLRPAALVATVHGYTHGRGLDRMRLYKWLDVRALRRFDRVVLVHEGMKAVRGIDTLGEERVRVIENGLPDSKPIDSGALDARVLAFCQDSVVIGAVGRLSPEKGFDRLIEAFARLVSGGVDAKLVVLGEGPERARLERMIVNKGLSGRVLMPGFVDGPSHLQLFSIFAMPSLTEGLPISLLEAMRAGLPIVATKVGAVPDVLGSSCGLLVEPNDIGTLTAALTRMIAEPSVASNLARAAERRVVAFSSDRMASRYLDEYLDVISRSEASIPETARGFASRR